MDSWSFFEAAHGKGAADGVGGAIKRNLDTLTAQGLDIPDAKTAFDALSSSIQKSRFFTYQLKVSNQLMR